MPYLTEHQSTDIISSWHPSVGNECVLDFEREWNIDEIDTVEFSALAPKTALKVATKYDIWADQNLTLKMATVFTVSLNPEPFKGHPLIKDDSSQEYAIFRPLCVGPTVFLKKKRINIRMAGAKISDIVKAVVRKSGIEFGIKDDFAYVRDSDFVLNVRYIAKLPQEILDDFREYGYQYYVDDDFNLHFFEDKQEVYGTIWDDETSYLNQFVLGQDTSDLRNAVRIFGKDKVLAAPDLLIQGTGDQLTGLDYNLPHNVAFDEDLLLEDWDSIDTGLWEIADSKGSTNPLSPDGSRVFALSGVLVFAGGSGTEGQNYVQIKNSTPRREGTAFIQTLTIDDFGTGFILAVGTGNQALDSELMGFYLKADGTLTIYEKGVEQAPASPIQLKRSFSGDTALSISNLDVTRKIFDLPTGYGAHFTVGETVTMNGPVTGLLVTTIDAKTGDQITLTDAIATGDYSETKLNRVIDYRLIIQAKASGFIYKIQGDGDTFGVLNSGIYTDIKETNTDTTPNLFVVPGAPKGTTCVFQAQQTFVLPSGGATFESGGKYFLVAPEDQGSAFDFPILIRAADPRKNPPLLRFRPSRMAATVNGGTATTTQIPVSEADFNEIYVGDRLLVNKKETFVDSMTEAGFLLNLSPALPGAPTDGTVFYVGSTALAEGVNGTFKYNYPTPNRAIFRDYDSIDKYGFSEDAPIRDDRLITREDLVARFNAFKEAKAEPQISGRISFEMSPLIKLNN
jgi:hypothetical protein